MMHKLARVEVQQYPKLTVTFADGFRGELDLSLDIASKPMFAELRDVSFFNEVELAPDGYSLGWKLDQLGNEIDLSADGIRIDIETEKVIEAAARGRSKKHAAE